MQRDPGPALWVEWEPTLGLLRADLLQRIGKPLRSAHPSGAAQQPQVAVTQDRWALPWIANQLFVRFSVIGSERECSECF